ncbi:hypothetical protein G7Y79_00006g017970 [Physcia stellaris]|nr:hypothetical protein G7Y79_00006g017970 [Physcia stellaris]
MLKLTSKVGALIRTRVGTRKGRKEDKENKKIQKQAARNANEEKKAEKKESKKHENISWPVPHAATTLLDDLSTQGNYGFNHVLDRHHTPPSGNPHPIDIGSTADYDRQPGNSGFDQRVALYLAQQPVSQTSLRVTNGTATPSTSTESLVSRLSTAANQAMTAKASRVDVADSHPSRSHLSVECNDEDEEISHQKGLGHNTKISKSPEHEHIVSETAQGDAGCEPLLTDDIPLDGIPTLHGDGSRFHQYSRPETFGGSSQAHEDHPIQAARDPFKRPKNPVPLTLQSLEEEEEEATARPKNATQFGSNDKTKRQGRVFHDSELPPSLRIGYTDPADTPVTPLSPRDEADLHFTSPPSIPRPATHIRPPPDLPTPPQNYSDPDLAHSISDLHLYRNVQPDAVNPDDFLTPPLPIPRRASISSTIPSPSTGRWSNYLSRHDQDPRLHRNISAELLSLPGHHGDGHLPLTPSTTSILSLRNSVFSSSTDSTDTKNLRNKLVHILSEHESKHTKEKPDTGSSESLFRKVAEIIALPGHHGRAFAPKLAGPVVQGVRSTTPRDVLRSKPSYENLRSHPSMLEKRAPGPLAPGQKVSLSRTTSVGSMNLLMKGVGRGIKKAAKGGWRKLWEKSRGREGERSAMDMILFDAIGPALEDTGLGVDFADWGR